MEGKKLLNSRMPAISLVFFQLGPVHGLSFVDQLDRDFFLTQVQSMCMAASHAGSVPQAGAIAHTGLTWGAIETPRMCGRFES